MCELILYASERGLKIDVEARFYAAMTQYVVVCVAGVRLTRPIYLGNLCQALARIDVWTAGEVA